LSVDVQSRIVASWGWQRKRDAASVGRPGRAVGERAQMQQAQSGAVGADRGEPRAASAVGAFVATPPQRLRGAPPAACLARRRARHACHPAHQAFIESWFGKLKERCVWLHEFETLDEATEVIGAHIDGYHQRPHSGLNYRTPAEVAQTWDDALGNRQTHPA
jgi:transposase InsO family protein